MRESAKSEALFGKQPLLEALLLKVCIAGLLKQYFISKQTTPWTTPKTGPLEYRQNQW